MQSKVALEPFTVALTAFFNFVILYVFGRIPWKGDQPIARPILTQRDMLYHLLDYRCMLNEYSINDTIFLEMEVCGT
jgi:hypothetical protein